MTDEERAAAFKFVEWMTSPERAADWGIATGYVAVRPDAWDTPTMKKYVADFPAAAVARDQLKYAVAELSTHDNQRVTKALNDGLQAALTGTQSLQQVMRRRKGGGPHPQALSVIHGVERIADVRPQPRRSPSAAGRRLRCIFTARCCCCRPRPACCLHVLSGGADAHRQLLLDPARSARAVFVGLDNYQTMLADPVFWRALQNNVIYAASVIPLTIALALAMALLINGKIAGRPFLRLSFCKPTVSGR